MTDGPVPRLRRVAWSVQALLTSIATLVLLIVAAVSAALITVWVGLPVFVAAFALTGRLAGVTRRRTPRMDGGEPIGSPYLRPVRGNLLVRTRAVLVDPARRRDALWLLVDGTLGLALSIVAVVESLLDLVLWWLPAGLALRVHTALGRALLSTSEKSRLARRVEQLTESRAETVDLQAAELRRIERDLHDGAQARLVAMGINLALADDRFDHDPAGARALVAEARESSSAALAELRDLVRGIHPPVLADRGLVGAVQALALAVPLPVEVRADVPDRLPAPAESAAYFAIAEALTNLVKHASASHAAVAIGFDGAALHVSVLDDGHGGADPRLGTGLRGIERRLSAFDGSLRVSSPPGGPTELAMVLPCAPSSPKTLPSSVTA